MRKNVQLGPVRPLSLGITYRRRFSSTATLTVTSSSSRRQVKNFEPPQIRSARTLVTFFRRGHLEREKQLFEQSQNESYEKQQ